MNRQSEIMLATRKARAMVAGYTKRWDPPMDDQAMGYNFDIADAPTRRLGMMFGYDLFSPKVLFPLVIVKISGA